MICPKYMQPFFMLMQKNLKVIKSLLLTAPAVTNKAANEKKICPYRRIPRAPAIFPQECCDKWYFSPPDHAPLRL